VPAFNEREAQRFPYRDHPQVEMSSHGDLSDEAAVAQLFAAVPRPWASIHIAGGFAAGPITETSKADLMRQIDMNLVTCFLCCRAAVDAMAKTGGRIVNVAARPALEWRGRSRLAAHTARQAAGAARPAPPAAAGP